MKKKRLGGVGRKGGSVTSQGSRVFIIRFTARRSQLKPEPTRISPSVRKTTMLSAVAEKRKKGRKGGLEESRLKRKGYIVPRRKGATNAKVIEKTSPTIWEGKDYRRVTGGGEKKTPRSVSGS